MRKFKIVTVFISVIFIFDHSNNFNSKTDAYSLKSSKKEYISNALTLHEAPAKLETSLEYEDDENVHLKEPATSLLKKCDACPEGIACVPLIQCPAHVLLKDNEKPQICDLSSGKFGFCCVTGQNFTAPSDDKARMPPITFVPLQVVEEARLQFQALMHHAAQLPVRHERPDFFHGMVFHSSPQEDVQNFDLSNSAMEQVITNQVFSKKEHIPVDEIITNNMQLDVSKTPLAQTCVTPPSCRSPHPRYRTLDGSCNNPLPQRSQWGAAGQPMERLLPPAYEDGIWTARQHAVDGSPLMGAREISRILLADVNRPHPKHNLMLMQFGQFLAHDVSQSESVRLENGAVAQCCSQQGAAVLPPEERHFACMPIAVEPNDEFYSVFNIRCLNFVRLSLAPNIDCRIGFGKQRNKVTHFLDGSAIYGSSEQQARDLRAFRGGELRMFNDFGREQLPLSNEGCGAADPEKVCFKSGDGRTNQIISLVAVHLLFAREHNRIARALSQLNPHHSDELIFQEARRIVIAQLQHIIYNEYLPSIVGATQMKRFRLEPQSRGYGNGYHLDVNPAITNEFSGAAFRMGHSSVDGRFQIRDKNGQIVEMISIPDVMFNPSRLRQRSFFNDLLRALFVEPMQKVDSSITHGLTRFLFRGDNPFGVDLAAINIQRGRDHGLRSYNDYLQLMGFRRLRSFNQLPAEVAAKLSQVYKSPDDIELWIGGLLEKPIAGGVVGLTFSEIIADQFSRFKHGDRYFYEYSPNINPGAFTLTQLQEIRKVTMARIICNNRDQFELFPVPPAAFVRADIQGNQPMSCDSPLIPAVNLEAWRA